MMENLISICSNSKRILYFYLLVISSCAFYFAIFKNNTTDNNLRVQVYNNNNLHNIQSQSPFKAAARILDLWAVSDGNFVVIHWPRLEQQKLCRNIDDFSYDFSVNCDIPVRFIQAATIVKKRHNHLTYVITDEQDVSLLNMLYSFGLLSHGNISIFESHPNFVGIPIDIDLIEQSFLLHAKYIYGAGQHKIHLEVSKLRALNGDLSFAWRSLPGVNNDIVVVDKSFSNCREGECLKKAVVNMMNKLDTAVTPGPLNAVVLNFHIPEIDSGRIEIFLRRMKTVSSLNFRPLFYFITYSSIGTLNEIKILRILSDCGLMNQFSGIRFYSFYNDTDVTISLTGKSKSHKSYSLFNGPNALFYDTMSYLSSQNVSVALLLEPDVIFIDKYWLDKLYSLSVIDSYWIYGAKYHGASNLDSKYMSHLNGVALYNVGDPNFMEFLLILKAYHKYFNFKFGDANYDVIWSLLVDEFSEKKMDSLAASLDTNRKHVNIVIRAINNNLLSTNCILNFSPELDANRSVAETLHRYKKAILLHKKVNI